MDDFIKLLKFGLNNRVAILSVWVMIFGVAGAGGYFSLPDKPVEPVKIAMPLPEPIEKISPPPPPTVIERIVIKEVSNCEAICKGMVRKHEKAHHFIR